MLQLFATVLVQKTGARGLQEAAERRVVMVSLCLNVFFHCRAECATPAQQVTNLPHCDVDFTSPLQVGKLINALTSVLDAFHFFV